MDPPFEQNLSDAFAYKLNSLASRGNHKNGDDRYLSDHPVVVQRVKRAHNTIRCHPHQQHLGSQKNHTTNLRGNSSDGRLLFSVQQNEECDEVEQSSSIYNDNGALPAWLKRMIPSCAQDVFVTLRKVKPMESEGSGCLGMIIRDDIILTTRECSIYNYTFNSPEASTHLKNAYPQISLNNKEEMRNSRFGFLTVDAPPHHYFIDQQYHRARLFLSLQSTPSPVIPNSNKQNISSSSSLQIKDDVVAVTCDVNDEHKPIVHNFPANGGQEMIPLSELYGLVPDDILWEHADIDTAPTLTFKNERWWSKAVSLEDEEEFMKSKIEEYRGPAGSVSISNAHKNKGFISTASALCEALDPRGHRRDACFKHYYTLWRDEVPFSRMHLFDWLDHGNTDAYWETSDLLLDDEKCAKERFNRKTVHYFNDTERDLHEVYVTQSNDGTRLIFRYTHNDDLVPVSDKDDPHLYVWGLDEKFYIVDNTWDWDKFGEPKHTSVFAGMPVLAGGKMYFEEDGSVWITFNSGHYRPNISAMSMMYQWTKDQGFNTTALHWVPAYGTGWSEKDCDETAQFQIEIPGYNSTSLEKSCREVTNSPTWVDE